VDLVREYRTPLETPTSTPAVRSEPAHSVGTGVTRSRRLAPVLLGLPVVYAVIGGEPEQFGALVQLYRQAGQAGGPRGGHAACHDDRRRPWIAEDTGTPETPSTPYWNQSWSTVPAPRLGRTGPRRLRPLRARGPRPHDRYPDEVAERIITVGSWWEPSATGCRWTGRGYRTRP